MKQLEVNVPLSPTSGLSIPLDLQITAVLLWETAAYHSSVGRSIMERTATAVAFFPSSSQHQLLPGQDYFSAEDFAALRHVELLTFTDSLSP